MNSRSPSLALAAAARATRSGAEAGGRAPGHSTPRSLRGSAVRPRRRRLTGGPMSDGGPGFRDPLADAFQGRRRFGERLATVSGPLGTEVTARYLIELRGGPTGDAADLEVAGHPTAYIEVAEACGLHLVPA